MNMYLLTIILLACGEAIGTLIVIAITMVVFSNKKLAKRYLSWAYSISSEVVNEVLEENLENDNLIKELERRLEEV